MLCFKDIVVADCFPRISCYLLELLLDLSRLMLGSLFLWNHFCSHFPIRFLRPLYNEESRRKMEGRWDLELGSLLWLGKCSLFVLPKVQDTSTPICCSMISAVLQPSSILLCSCFILQVLFCSIVSLRHCSARGMSSPPHANSTGLHKFPTSSSYIRR